MSRRGWVAGLAAAALSLALVAVPGAATSPATAGVNPSVVGTDASQCPSWSGLPTSNPYQQVMSGVVKIPGFPAAKVGSGASISWGANPYRNESWRIWFTSLKWLGNLASTATGHDYLINGVRHRSTPADSAVALDRITAIVRSYLAANPRLTSSPTAEQIASMGHRTQALACLAEAIGRPAWLVNAARAHAAYIAAHWKGAWNQGLEQDLGALAVGCIIGPSSIAVAAAARMDFALRRSVLPDGSSNEQAPGYAGYSYVQWTTALAKLQQCGLQPPAGFDRLPKLAEFVAQATQPDGNLVQIGDTSAVPPSSWTGTPTEYVGSGGATGTAPASRVGVYPNGGYVLGRSTWAPPLSAASFYSLRFGPGTTLHGHFDHTAVTWYARGHNVLMDSGFPGYSNAKLRVAMWQPAAHNELAIDGVHPAHTVTTLTRSVQSDLFDAYTVVDKPNPGVSRARSILVTHGAAPDVMVVNDWSAAVKTAVVPKIAAAVFRQHWHLPPGYAVGINSKDQMTATAGGEKVTFVRVPIAGTPATRSAAVTTFAQAADTGQVRPNRDAQFTSAGWSTRMLTVGVPSATGDAVSVVRTPNPDGTSTLTVTVGAAVVFVTLDSVGTPVGASLPAPPAPPADPPASPAA